MDFPDSFPPLSPTHDQFNIADLVADDNWLGPAVNATAELTEFPDDAIAASLAALSGRDEDDGMFFPVDRPLGRNTSMRTSFSMNDLQALQHQPAQPMWNHKLVSVKPKLQPVPESGPCHCGPLNLMPLPNGMTSPEQLNDTSMMPGLDEAMDDFADLDSDGPEGLHKQLPSTGSLAQQLQMTHVGSNHNLAALDNHHATAFSGAQQMCNHSGNMYAQAGLSNGHMSSVQQHPGALEAQLAAVEAEDGSAMSRKPTGLPLRKSQSALELSSWRSFVGTDDFWDQEGSAGEPSKPWKLTPEERMQRIQRYREKRLNRNFNPAVKYQCRKSLADTRPRVRGRFARNDDIGIVMPHESKKAQRERANSSNSTDALSSDQTSSGGPGATSSGRNGSGVMGGHGLHTSFGSLQQGATSPLTGLFASPPASGMTPHSGMHQRHASLTQLDASTSSVMTSLQGISMIGATPETLLQPDLGMLPPMQGPSSGGLLPPLAPSSFPPMPPVIGPSSGGIFTSAARSNSLNNSYSPQSSTGLFGGAMPPYIPTGQTIFSGQTIFTGGNSSAANNNNQQSPLSGAFHPTLSLPLQPLSPAASDSNSHSVGLSLGDISSL